MQEEELAPVEEGASEAVAVDQVAEEQPTPEQQEQPEVEVKEEPVEQQRPRKKNKTTARERISQLTHEKRLAEAEVQRLREQLGKPPKMEDFEDPDEFEAERTKAAIRSVRLEEAEHRVTSAQAQAQEAMARDFAARVEEYVEESGVSRQQFEAVAYRAPVSDEVSEIIAQMDGGPAVAYHLGQNPARAQEISTLPPTLAALELAEIRSSLRPPAPKVVSSAPKPIAPVTDGGGPPSQRLFGNVLSGTSPTTWQCAGLSNEGNPRKPCLTPSATLLSTFANEFLMHTSRTTL